MSNSLGIYRPTAAPSRTYGQANSFKVLQTAANLFGWQKKEDLPDPTIISEDEGSNFYRDLNELDSKLTRIKSVRLEESMSNHMHNALHGQPLVALATEVVIDYIEHWRNVHTDIEQVAWNETATAGIPDGSTWYSYISEGASARYKYTLDILYEVLNHPEIGVQNLNFMMRMFRETAVTTIMKNTARALAFRPYRNFLTRHQRAKTRATPLELYRRATDALFMGVNTPDVLYSKISRKMHDANMTLDTVVVPDICLNTLKDQLLDNRDYNTQIHDTTGKVEGFTNGIKELTFNQQKQIAIDGVSTLLLAMPSFKVRNEHNIAESEQSLAKNLTLAQAYVFRRPMVKSNDVTLNQNALSTLVGHVSSTGFTWRGFSLAHVVQKTGCGLWFDTKNGNWSKEAQVILARYNEKHNDGANAAHFEALAALDSMDEPSSEMRKRVNDGNLKMLGWRDLPLFYCFNKTAGKYELAKTYGQMEEPILPTEVLADAMEVFLQQHGDKAEDILQRIYDNKPQARPGLRGPAPVSSPSMPTFQSRELNQLLSSNLPNPVYDLFHAQGKGFETMVATSADTGKRMVAHIKQKFSEPATSNIGHAKWWANYYLEKLAPYMREQNPEVLTSVKATEIMSHLPDQAVLHKAHEDMPTGERFRVLFAKSRDYASALKAAPLAGMTPEEVERAPDATADMSITRQYKAPMILPTYSTEVQDLVKAILKTEITLTSLVALLKQGIPVIGGRLERFSMRFIVGSMLLLKKGASCCKQHVSPMLAHWGMKPVEGRVNLTGQLNDGFEFGDDGAIQELPGAFPIAFLGGMNTGLVTSIQDLKTSFTNRKYTSSQRAMTNDLVFLPRPISESNDEYPQYAFARRADESSGLDYRSETIFLRVSSCHFWLQELLFGTRVIEVANASNRLGSPSSKGEYAPDACGFVEKAPSYGFVEGVGWVEHHAGTGPLGELRYFTPKLLKILKGDAGSFPVEPEERAAIESFDSS